MVPNQESTTEDAQIDSFTRKKPVKMTKIEIAQSKSEKYYKQFDFFFNRSCFRIMTEFYKEKFNRFYKEKLASLKKTNLSNWQRIQKGGGLTSTTKEEMDSLMQQFFGNMFGEKVLKNE